MKILNNDMYLLLIDEEAKISEGDTVYEGISGIFAPYEKEDIVKNPKKIIAYYPLTKEAKELDLPLLPNPFKEVDIERLACEKYSIKEGLNDYDERYYNSHNVAKAEAFIEGYKAAQQSDKQFSLDDMKKAFEAGANWQEGGTILYPDIHGFAQSLSTQQTYPKEFIPDTEIVYASKGLADKSFIYEEVFKTITNSEGKQELVGVWVVRC